MTETPKENIIAKVSRTLYLAMEFKQCSNVKHIELLLKGFEKELLQEQAKEKKKKIEAIILKHKQEIKGIGYLLNQKCILRDILLEVDKWVIKNEIL